MKLVSSLCLVVLVSVSTANPAPAPAPATSTTSKCANVLDSGFAAVVAHGIHSMTLDALKKFDPTATENNFVPVVQYDLRAEQPILPYAPDLKSKDSDMFLTDGMKTLDLIMTHMNDKHWDVAAFNALERVVHAFHMQEVWAHTEKEFEKLGKDTPAPDENFCQCAMDLENNGIMKNLRFLALAIREPGLVYGDPSYSNRSYDGPVKGYYLQYNFGGFANPKNGQEVQMLHDKSEAMPPLKDGAAWDYWKGKANPPKEHHRNVSQFLYCAIQKAHKS